MSNSIGKSVVLTLFGESHGPYIGVVIDGLSAGLVVDHEFINLQLAKRRPTLAIETSRVEKDNYEIISGVMNGYTTGMPLCIIIPNENVRSNDYEKNHGKWERPRLNDFKDLKAFFQMHSSAFELYMNDTYRPLHNFSQWSDTMIRLLIVSCKLPMAENLRKDFMREMQNFRKRQSKR